jgi:hypothetical protein
LYLDTIAVNLCERNKEVKINNLSMVTVYLLKNLRYGHAEVCLAYSSHAILLKIFVKIKNTEASLRR